MRVGCIYFVEYVVAFRRLVYNLSDPFAPQYLGLVVDSGRQPVQ